MRMRTEKKLKRKKFKHGKVLWMTTKFWTMKKIKILLESQVLDLLYDLIEGNFISLSVYLFENIFIFCISFFFIFILTLSLIYIQFFNEKKIIIFLLNNFHYLIQWFWSESCISVTYRSNWVHPFTNKCNNKNTKNCKRFSYSSKIFWIYEKFKNFGSDGQKNIFSLVGKKKIKKITSSAGKLFY